MTTPAPTRRILIERNPKRVLIHFNGQPIADSGDTLMLFEADASPVIYIPRKDVDMRLLTRAPHATFCPYKGTASYFSIHAGARHATQAVWTYEQPLQAVEPIRDHLAFYEDLIDRIEQLTRH